MNSTADSILTRIAAENAAAHWLATGQPMARLADVLSFAWGLPDDGLPFQARSREDRTAVETLKRRGLIEVRGATSGVRVRLTLAGSACFWHLDIAARTAAAVADAPTVKTPWGASVVLGCEFCPSAGQWWARASASDAGWNRYTDELASVQNALKPLFCLGWARQYVSTDQRLWAVALTDTGREAAAHPPQIEPGPFSFDAEAYATAWTDACRRFSANPPDCGGSVPRFLPASKWPEVRQ